MGRWSRPEDVKAEELFKISEKVSKLTRLFAEENLQVSFDSGADTACFYPGSRVLQFPYNFVMLSDDDIMMLFLTHEVGHAFWSSVEYIKKAIDECVKTYANIVDDIRIERKLKDKYPGLVGTFDRGYRKLYNDGFFSSPEMHPMLGFANRLNIYAKCGPLTAKNIKLAAEEVEFYLRCMKAETEDDVLALAKELRDMDIRIDSTLELDEETLKRLTSNFEFVEEADVDESFDDSGTNAPVGIDESDDSSEGMSDEERDSRQAYLNEILDSLDVQFEMDKKIKNANTSGVSFTLYESMPETKHYTYKDFIQGYHHYATAFNGMYRQQVVKFMNDISRSVAYMAQEFEMKKAAARYKNAKVSTSGKIDVNRVFKFKYDDQIFANRMVFKDDKRHGMVILLDGSGSITRQFPNMIRQVILLTEYAKKIGVPFKVFMFGSEMIIKDQPNFTPGVEIFKNSVIYNSIYRKESGHFYEVLCSDMTREEYYQAAEILMYGRTRFGNTPTGEAMIRLEAPMAKFFASHNVTNKKLFIITDGQPSDTNSYLANYVMVDPITEKTYRTNTSATYTPISMLGKIFKDRYDIDMISMVLTSARRELSDFIPSDSAEFVRVTTDKTFAKNKFVKTVDMMGLPIFAIKPSPTETAIDMNVSGNTSIASAASQLAKAMSKMQLSQVLLQALSEQFAV